MATIPDAHKKVPRMFQAQTKGRCQLNFIDTKNKQKQDVEFWTDEWVKKAEDKVPEFPETVQTKAYKLSWRFVTNGGQDEGVIRPVIGAGGVPFYPGSSMKGAFRKACRSAAADKVNYYCGDADNPGILRFHGGYPTDDSWRKDLVDIVHPQQDWQVKNNKKTGAFALISLYQPELRFGISSTETLNDEEWENVWQIWEKAVSEGLGCRISAGYGQPKKQTDKIIYRAFLEGQGITPKVIGGKREFRPNVFKAAIRGHALRIFGGLTDANTAESIIERLFGGVSNGGTFGLLAMNWNDARNYPIEKTFKKGIKEKVYEAKGVLRWRLTQNISAEKQKSLTELISALMRFSLLLGGFGKSWRRADHRLFFPQYYERRDSKKSLIGCHWQWYNRSLNESDLIINSTNLKRTPKIIGSFIDETLKTARKWMQHEGIKPNPGRYANWREAWHHDNAQVWGGIAEDRDDSFAIRWFHGAYQSEKSIKTLDLTGKMGKIGRIWHRMYPIAKPRKNRETGKTEFFYPDECNYLELITIFPDKSKGCQDFIKFIGSDDGGFTKLW